MRSDQSREQDLSVQKDPFDVMVHSLADGYRSMQGDEDLPNSGPAVEKLARLLGTERHALLRKMATNNALDLSSRLKATEAVYLQSARKTNDEVAEILSGSNGALTDDESRRVQAALARHAGIKAKLIGADATPQTTGGDK